MRIPSRALVLGIAIMVAVAALSAQQARSLEPAEYGRWEQLAAQRTPLSPDGQWLVYGIARASRQNELRVQRVDGGPPVAIAFGEQPAFSDDSRWLACLVGFSEEDEARRRKDKKPLHKQLALVELATGRVTNVDGIESFSFSSTGAHLAMRRYAPERAEGSGAPAEDDDTVRTGTTLVIRELASGRDTTFGSVSEMAWQHRGSLLAFTVTAEGNLGNGAHLFDAASGTLRVLDSSSNTYSGLAWRKESASLAVLRSLTDEAHDGPTQTVLAWPDVQTRPDARHELDPAKSTALTPDLRIVRYRTPTWSHDGSLLFLGVAPWAAKPAPPVRETLSRRVLATSDNPDELPDVQVWHAKDTTVMPKQKIDRRRDRERSMLTAWRVADGGVIRVAQAIGEEGTPIRRQSRALVVDTNAFAMERSIGRVYGNLSMVDLAGGTRSDVATRVLDRYVESSPGGRYLLYLKNDHYWSVDIASGRQTNLTATVSTSFVDKESDQTGDQKPPFGVAGWTRDDAAVLLYDKLDIWEVRPDGSGATRLTNGTPGEIRHRFVRLDPEEEWIDRAQPLMLSMFGLRSKKSGYAQLSPSGAGVSQLVWLDKRVDRLAKAPRADRFVYAVEGFDDSPDYFSATAGLADAKPVTNTNPFMGEYAWGRSTVIDYRSKTGQPLQAALYYPAGYQPGRRYPTVVYMYERLSDGVHRFSMPSERDYYNAAAFTTRGYVYLQPDITFRPRDPGVSVIESVLPAVQRAVELGAADSSKVGIIGHSWGGFDSVYLATHTDTFAAAVAGAPITNLVSNYGGHHWTSGIAETDHIETGQQRMEVPIYEDLQAYIRNSAVFRAHTMRTPLLVMFGDNDGTVHWHQGVELYNVARRAGKPVVLLQYGGEDHGLRKRANQVDYHHRIFEWFDHYLKGGAAATWIKSGERYVDRERDLRERKLPVKVPKGTTEDGRPPALFR